jgi:hypothetical protein
MDIIPSASDKTEQARPPHGCGGCDNRWGGFRTAHCGACHETFTTPANFDRHRLQDECAPPADRGLVLNERGQWAQPGREDAA